MVGEHPRAGQKAVIYVRTSTDKQETGLVTQYGAVKELAATLGIEVVIPPFDKGSFNEAGEIDEQMLTAMKEMPGAWVDEGKSGGLDPLERPGFVAMMKWLEEEEIGLVLLYHNDRLSRDTETTLRVLRVSREGDPPLHYLFGNVPDLMVERPEDEMMLTNLAMLATYFRKDLARKTKAGMNRLKREGRWLGETPYGLYAITKADDPDNYGVLLYHWGELDMLVKMMSHFINSNPRSYYRTAKWMNAQGFTTRRGKEWSKNHVKNILKTGVVSFKRDDDNKKVAQFFPDEMFEEG
jgi:DNA invertase Pin-like site-specific DNA recombinase